MGYRVPLETKLPGMLDAGERVEFIALATPGGSWRSEFKDARMLVLTGSRMLLVSVKLLAAENLAREAAAPETQEISYADIREITERFGLLESKLLLDVAGQEVWLTSMRKKSARTAAEVIRRNAKATSALRDTLTDGERSLVRDGRTALVLQTRKAYQDTMGADLIAGVEGITGRKVDAFMSDNHIDPDVAVESFVLKPQSDPAKASG